MWRLDIRDAAGLGFASQNRCTIASPESPVVPNIKSAEKNMRKSRAAAVRNRAQRSALRTALKKATDPQATDEARRGAVSLLDRAARKGLIHRNAAARYKSRLAKAGK
ncbi:MAG: 30S ribosomal protein S20 [Gemmatimonadaceae bacterium]